MRVTEVFIDANLLVLLVVGLVDRRLVGSHRRVRAFQPEDYDRLVEMIENDRKVFVTPNILTEASNLLESQDTRFLEKLRELIEFSQEITIASTTAAHNSGFTRLGLTDAGLLEVVSAKRPLITTDFALYRAALQKGEEAAFNFTYTQNL
ncbi:MAG: hypothetical protein OXB98_10390 [Bryobacterales bacterium]|nr:hypothetical protein [Bryobacterales bacterium]